MLKHPLVSIGVPAYNRAYGFKETLDCLINQSYKNIEIIISDDASNDDTYKICQEYAKKDKRIKIFRQKKNLGLPKNHNFVLSKATGEYFMWGGDDDLRSKDYVEILVSSLIKYKKAVLAVSDYIEFKGSYKNPIYIGYKNYLKSYQAILIYLIKTDLLFWGMYKTEIIKKVGGFHQDNRLFLNWGSDNITVFKVLLQGDLVHIKKNILYKRDSGYALDRYKTLEQLSFSKEVLFRIKRYLLFPLMFTYDLYYLLKFTAVSDFFITNKLQIITYAFWWYIRMNLGFAKEIVKGGFFVLKGLTLKLKVIV